MKILALIVPSFLFVASLVSPASALSVPEKLIYDVHWSGMRAGSAVQEVSSQGDGVHIVSTIRSSGLMSAFFSIDDRTESVISTEPATRGMPLSFKENINERKYHTRKEASFDFENLKANSKDLLKNSETSHPISARTQDSLSGIYFIRSSELIPGRSFSFDLYDLRHLWNAEVRVVRREEVRTPLGKFKTIKITSQLTSNGVSARAGSATIWLTDDDRRIPVKMSTKLKVGEITLSLVGGNYWS